MNSFDHCANRDQFAILLYVERDDQNRPRAPARDDVSQLGYLGSPRGSALLRVHDCLGWATSTYSDAPRNHERCIFHDGTHVHYLRGDPSRSEL
jgi:hypothetical protein